MDECSDVCSNFTASEFVNSSHCRPGIAISVQPFLLFALFLCACIRRLHWCTVLSCSWRRFAGSLPCGTIKAHAFTSVTVTRTTCAQGVSLNGTLLTRKSHDVTRYGMIITIIVILWGDTRVHEHMARWLLPSQLSTSTCVWPYGPKIQRKGFLSHVIEDVTIR